VLGAAEIPDDLAVDHVTESELPSNWATLDPSDQSATRAIGHRWLADGSAVVLLVPSIISGERNYAPNPTHPAFGRMAFAAPIPFHFDLRLVRQAPYRAQSERASMRARTKELAGRVNLFLSCIVAQMVRTILAALGRCFPRAAWQDRHRSIADPCRRAQSPAGDRRVPPLS